mmetsp:Transcript_11682/g.16366  ORF Transcript_11682/g.16366 Transcript_11682/m.16366 type:complete len:306 (+) Transcript_11682:147-1064(+)
MLSMKITTAGMSDGYTQRMTKTRRMHQKRKLKIRKMMIIIMIVPAKQKRKNQKVHRRKNIIQEETKRKKKQQRKSQRKMLPNLRKTNINTMMEMKNQQKKKITSTVMVTLHRLLQVLKIQKATMMRKKSPPVVILAVVATIIVIVIRKKTVRNTIPLRPMVILQLKNLMRGMAIRTVRKNRHLQKVLQKSRVMTVHQAAVHHTRMTSQAEATIRTIMSMVTKTRRKIPNQAVIVIRIQNLKEVLTSMTMMKTRKIPRRKKRTKQSMVTMLLPTNILIATMVKGTIVLRLQSQVITRKTIQMAEVK